MRVIGRMISVLARLTVVGSWRRLRGYLVSASARYRAFIRAELSPVVVRALIAAEDPRFYAHGGVDPIALWRGLFGGTDPRAGEGEITLEQRLVRILLGRRDRRLHRTCREILLASLVHRAVPKADIPGVYLSVAYFGWRMNGIRQACRRMGFELAELTPLQAAAIVARLRYPEPKAVSSRRARRISARAEQILRLIETRPAAGGRADVAPRVNSASP